MPKMEHPNQDRPMSVQDDEVEHYTGLGWTLVGGGRTTAKAEAKPAAKTAAKRAVTRKSAK